MDLSKHIQAHQFRMYFLGGPDHPRSQSNFNHLTRAKQTGQRKQDKLFVIAKPNGRWSTDNTRELLFCLFSEWFLSPCCLCYQLFIFIIQDINRYSILFGLTLFV